MDEIITQIVSGDLNVVSLLMLFILGILTKRFVPWWIHEEVLIKLKEYEDASPDLLVKIRELVEVVNDPKNTQKVVLDAPNASEISVNTQQEPITKIISENTQKQSAQKIKEYKYQHYERR